MQIITIFQKTRNSPLGCGVVHVCGTCPLNIIITGRPFFFLFFFANHVRNSVGRTGEDPDGHGRDRVQDLHAVREQERQLVHPGFAGPRARRPLVHCARARQGMLRHDRVPPEHGVAAHDELGGALVRRPPGYGAARVASRGGAAARTGSCRSRQRGHDLLGKHRQK